jgi:hypothetical protein
MTEVVFFHYRSRTVIFADLIQNLPNGWFTRIAGIVAPNPGAPRDCRVSFINRRAARASLERILRWPIERALIVHGEPVAVNGSAFVREAFSWLVGRQGDRSATKATK